MLDHPGSSRSFLMRRSMESASSGRMVAARRVPIPRRVAEEKLPLPLLAWSSAPGARTTVLTRVSTSSTRGADVEMDTHPSVDIEGYPVGEAGSMMVDGLPFHALLMNTGTDQGTLLIASNQIRRVR
jgi:hypothetical protein